jgi:hypothetical protein
MDTIGWDRVNIVTTTTVTVTHVFTFTGRGKPRPMSQRELDEAVGTGNRPGSPLSQILKESTSVTGEPRAFKARIVTLKEGVAIECSECGARATGLLATSIHHIETCPAREFGYYGKSREEQPYEGVKAVPIVVKRGPGRPKGAKNKKEKTANGTKP